LQVIRNLPGIGVRYLLPATDGVNKYRQTYWKDKDVPQSPDDFTAQDALVAIMIAVSASDESIRTSELVTIERMVNHLPVFADYPGDRLKSVSNVVFNMFQDEDGLDQLWEMTRRALPVRMFETAYVMACDVVAADGKAGESELRLLEEMRYELNIDRLHAAAIERAARARHMAL
jgi:uncharacterized tellurite resistance protein B-like protein